MEERFADLTRNVVQTFGLYWLYSTNGANIGLRVSNLG